MQRGGQETREKGLNLGGLQFSLCIELNGVVKSCGRPSVLSQGSLETTIRVRAPVATGLCDTEQERFRECLG
jgi:hypothetical protein